MSGNGTVDLYVDDSGSRHPDHGDPLQRRDGMDVFALGGILVDSERASQVFDLHRAFVERMGIDYPLHSHSLRTRSKNFTWLAEDTPRARLFYAGLNDLIANMPALVLACVVSRVGYNVRYKSVYGSERWRLRKSAYMILVDRAAKWALSRDRRLKIYVEETAKSEDRAIRDYHRELHEAGLPFDADRSARYQPLEVEKLREALFKNPTFRPTLRTNTS